MAAWTSLPRILNPSVMASWTSPKNSKAVSTVIRIGAMEGEWWCGTATSIWRLLVSLMRTHWKLETFNIKNIISLKIIYLKERHREMKSDLPAAALSPNCQQQSKVSGRIESWGLRMVAGTLNLNHQLLPPRCVTAGRRNQQQSWDLNLGILPGNNTIWSIVLVAMPIDAPKCVDFYV